MGRVTFVVTAEILGGGELYLLRFAQTLASRVPVRVVGRRNTPILQEAQSYGLATEELDLGRKLGVGTALYDVLYFPMAQRRLDRLMRNSPADELFIFQYKWEQLLWGGRHTGERVILWEHGPVPKNLLKLPWARRVLRRAYREALTVFAMSEPARRSVGILAQVDPLLLPAGLDLADCTKAHASRNHTRQELDLPATTPVLGFVGRVTEDKGILDVVTVLRQMPSATLLVCGEGQALSAAQRLSREHGLESRVRWLGWRQDVLNILAAIDVLLLLSTSHGEGRPLVVLESLAVGTPILGLSDSPALEALGDCPGVYLTDSAHPAALQAAISTVLSRSRPVPVGVDWSSSIEHFLEVVGVEQTAAINP